jgi:hypothetical protein
MVFQPPHPTSAARIEPRSSIIVASCRSRTCLSAANRSEQRGRIAAVDRANENFTTTAAHGRDFLGGLYSIRGGDSPVTSGAIRVTVAGSASDRLGPARCACRRGTLTREPGRGDPRAAAAARRVQARQASPASSPDRPRLLGRRLPRMVAMAGRARDCEAGDRDRVAPPRFRQVLGVWVSAARRAPLSVVVMG